MRRSQCTITSTIRSLLNVPANCNISYTLNTFFSECSSCDIVTREADMATVENVDISKVSDLRELLSLVSCYYYITELRSYFKFLFAMKSFCFHLLSCNRSHSSAQD